MDCEVYEEIFNLISTKILLIYEMVSAPCHASKKKKKKKKTPI